MSAAILAALSAPKWSNTAFNGLNSGRDRMRSNRCGSVSLSGAALATGAAAGFLIIKKGAKTILWSGSSRGSAVIVVHAGRKVHESFAAATCTFAVPEYSVRDMDKNSTSAPHLFQPLTMRSVTLRNRVGVSPMCQYSADDGVANDWHFVHLGSRAVGGAGLVIVEATAVAPEGRITPGCLGLWGEKHVEPLARIAKFVKDHGAVAGIQIAHAGREASANLPWKGGAHLAEAQGGWPTIAPSAIPFGGELAKVPHAMTEADIARVQNDFVAAAKRASAAGFEWLELHAAHVYLFNEFLSPLANHRTDIYGGNFENRIRLLLDTARAVRQVWPDKLPLAVRISAIDWKKGGWALEQSTALAKLLKPEGVDLVDCSS